MKPPSSAWCWHNGRIVAAREASPSVTSMSLHMGLAVFDGVMAYWNDGSFLLHRASQHFERLLAGSERMGFRCPWTAGELEAGVLSLLEIAGQGQTLYVRPVVYRGAEHLWLTGIDDVPVDTTIVALPVARDVNKPLRCQISPVQRVSSRAIPVGWKVSGSYVNSYLCKRRAADAGYDDGLMLDRSGRIAETSAANFFLIRGSEVVTPSLSEDVFPGVTRDLIIEVARGLGKAVSEQDVFPSDLTSADAAFITSTLLEVRPLDEVGGLLLNAEGNRTFASILHGFREVVHARRRTTA